MHLFQCAAFVALALISVMIQSWRLIQRRENKLIAVQLIFLGAACFGGICKILQLQFPSISRILVMLVSFKGV